MQDNSMSWEFGDARAMHPEDAWVEPARDNSGIDGGRGEEKMEK